MGRDDKSVIQNVAGEWSETPRCFFSIIQNLVCHKFQKKTRVIIVTFKYYEDSKPFHMQRAAAYKSLSCKTILSPAR